MLRITASKNAAGASQYFAQNLSQGDYYLPEDEKTIGHWHGRMAERLGLEGKRVAKQEFVALLNNRNPQDGGKLNPRDSVNRKVAYDFTWSVPKSVSLLMELNNDPKEKLAIEKAIKESMEETMAEMENQVHFQKGRDKEMIQSGEWAYGSFFHKTTRPIGGIAEPHAHIHAVVIHSTWNEKLQRHQAPEFSKIIKNAPYYESAFDSRLSYRLKAMGYPVERRGLSFEIAGMSDELLRKFSSRTAQVEAAAKKELAKHGELTAKQKAQLGARTRGAKESALISGKELKQQWQARLTKAEMVQIAQAKDGELSAPKKHSTQALHHAQSHLFERKSVALEKNDLRRLALKHSFGDILPEQLDAAIEKAGYFRKEIKGRHYVTTPDALKQEQKMLAYVRRSKGVKKPIHPQFTIDNPILNQAQRKAIMHVVRDSTDRVILLSGKAGVGKTSMMKQVQIAVHEKGVKFYGFAPTSKAAHGVLKSEGFKRSDTVAQLLKNPSLQDEVKDSVIFIDEAGLLGVREMNGIFEIAEKQNARVILAGDTRQHNSINQGDAMKIIERDGGVKVARVYDIQRQRHNPRYKQVVELAASGKVDKALHQLDAQGGVIEIADDGMRLQTLVEDYSKVVRNGKSALVVSPTKREGRQVTRAIRDHWRESGDLKQERAWTRMQKLGWTQAEKRDAFGYQDSSKRLLLEFHQNAKGGHRKGEQWQVVKQDGQLMMRRGGQLKPLALSQAERFTVFEKRIIPLGIGDKIRVTKNSKTVEGTHMHNGTVYKVKGFTRKGEIKLHTGKHLPKDFKHLDYGLVTTSHSAQGATVDEVFISQAHQTLASSQQQFYVSISRGRKRARIYTDDKRALERAVMRDGQRMTAREIALEQEWEVAQSRHRQELEQEILTKGQDHGVEHTL